MFDFICEHECYEMTISDPFLWIFRGIFRTLGIVELYNERRGMMHVTWDWELRNHIKFTLLEYQYYPLYNNRVIFSIRFQIVDHSRRRIHSFISTFNCFRSFIDKVGF